MPVYGTGLYGDALYGFGFGGGSATPGHYYVNLVPSYDLDSVFNRWTETGASGLTQTWQDLASQSAYGLRVKQITSLLASDDEVLGQLQWKSGQFSQPMNRVESITLMPLTDVSNVAQIDAGLGREVGDRITILETPPGFNTTQTNDYTIQHLSGSINTGAVASMQLTFGLWPAETQVAWIVGTPNLSNAGSSTRAGY